MNRSKIAIGMFLVLAVAGIASADSMGLRFEDKHVEIEGVVGTGSSQAIVFFDWKSGTTPSHAWLYNFDGTKTVADAYNDIESATGGAFDWDAQAFCKQMDYNDGSEIHLGDDDGWMSFWNGDSPDSMSTNPVGLFDQTLSDGFWYGANPIANPWPGSAPTIPVPEPATMGLLALGGLAVLRRRRA